MQPTISTHSEPTHRGTRRRSVADVVASLLGDDPPVGVDLWDRSSLGPSDAPARIVVRSPDALSRIVAAPGELGFARAYVAGDIELEGDIYAVLALRERIPSPHLTPRQWVDALRVLGPQLRVLAPPREEARPRGRRHSSGRDATAVSHHYDVGNDFYRIVLGPSMTYSCAVFTDAERSLEEAQWAKHELVCTKLGLRPGDRLLDVGCGWGSLARHAARHHGAKVVGITLSREQAQWARETTEAEGLGDSVEIRIQDYRHVADGPFDAISSVGMFEHVGLAQLDAYFCSLHGLLVPGGRFLNHAISRPPGAPPAIAARSFMGRYVFPDAELHEVGGVVTAMQAARFEARHLESIREHYALTLRRWVANLEADWDRAVELVGAGRARIWRLYMAGSALGFAEGRTGVDQVLAVRGDEGRSGLGLRPRWNASPRRAGVAIDLAGNGGTPRAARNPVG